jgi:hypothetical protein
LADGALAIDTGISLSDVAFDFASTPRPQGSAYDVGAYEHIITTAPPPPPPQTLTLSATGYKMKGMQRVDLVWGGAQSTTVDVYRNGSIILTTLNDSRETDTIDKRGSGTYNYKICDTGTANCSNVVTVAF